MKQALTQSGFLLPSFKMVSEYPNGIFVYSRPSRKGKPVFDVAKFNGIDNAEVLSEGVKDRDTAQGYAKSFSGI